MKLKYTSVATTAALAALTGMDVTSATSRTRGVVERTNSDDGLVERRRALSPENKGKGKGASVSLE